MTELASFQTGVSAPDVSLTDSAGSTIDLARLWCDQPLLIFFMRHFGCAACRQHMFHIRDAYPAIQERGGKAIAIAMHDPELTARFASTYRLPFPLFSDSSRQVYQAFHVLEGTHWETAGPLALLHLAKLATQGNVMAFPKSMAESKQLSGAFIVDTCGIVQLAHSRF